MFEMPYQTALNNHSQPLGTTLALGSLSKDKKSHICLHIHPKALNEKAKAVF